MCINKCYKQNKDDTICKYRHENECDEDKDRTNPNCFELAKKKHKCSNICST